VTTLEDGEVVLLEVGLLGIDGDGVTMEAEEMVGKVILRVGAVGRTTVLIGSAVGVGVGMFRVGAVARVVETTWVVVGAANASVHVTSKKVHTNLQRVWRSSCRAGVV